MLKLERPEMAKLGRKDNFLCNIALRACLTATLASATVAACGQTVVTLQGVQYTLKDHPRVWLDGSAGALTSAISSPTGRANLSNPAYVALTATVNNFIANGYADPLADYAHGDTYSHFATAAIRWQADGDEASLAAAKYGINHVENVVTSMGCDTTMSYCGNRFNDQDYTRETLVIVAQAYSIVRSQLSVSERVAFAGKILNDNDVSHNGIDTAQCSKQGLNVGGGTLTGSGTTITISGGTTSQLASGSVIFDTSNNQLAVVQSITDSTHFVTYESVTWSGLGFHYSPPWSGGNCGLIWFVKHHNAAPPIVLGQESHYTTDYPNGNTYVYPGENLTFSALISYIMVGLALADDDPRAVTLLQQAYNYYIANQYTYARSSWTGFTQSGAAYSPWRVHWYSSLIAISIQNSLINGPDLTQGVYLKRQLPFYYYGALPDVPTQGLTFQDIYASIWNQYGLRSLWPVLWLYPGSAEAGYANYYARTTRGDFNSSSLAYNQGSYLPYSYVFSDPAQSATDLSSAPSQYLFRDTDYGACGNLGLACTAGIAYSHAISRTGWSSDDDLVLIQGAYNDGRDHSGNGDWGSVHIYRKGYLLAGDATYGNHNLGSDNLIELGGGNNWVQPGYASFLRWAGANPTGDAQSRFTYALVDMTQAYSASQQATRVHRHVAHFKKPGFQDYIVWYDDVATATGGMKKAYLHYFLNGIAPGVAINFNGSNNGGDISNTQARSTLRTTIVGTGGSNSALIGKDNTDGSYTGGGGHTYRAYVCAENPVSPGTCDSSSTTGEWAVVHMPTTTGAAMPGVVQDTAANFRVVEIQDAASPKVAAFAQGGATYTTASFATTHSGTAQYLIAGLTPGYYNVTVNGTSVAMNVVVSNGDNTLYFESTSGAVIIAAGGVPSACDLNKDGVVNNADVALGVNVALSPSSCTSQYDLNQDGVCNVVDVQRVINGALGLSCKVGP